MDLIVNAVKWINLIHFVQMNHLITDQRGQLSSDTLTPCKLERVLKNSGRFATLMVMNDAECEKSCPDPWNMRNSF